METRFDDEGSRLIQRLIQEAFADWARHRRDLRTEEGASGRAQTRPTAARQTGPRAH